MTSQPRRSEVDESDYDAMGDGELLARCAASRAVVREHEISRGLAVMGAQRLSDDQKLKAFMHTFHPDHPSLR